MYAYAAHARMMASLEAGERGVYSYLGTCPHQGPEASARCTCPKMLNVLLDGALVRYVNNEPRPVFALSEFQAILGGQR